MEPDFDYPAAHSMDTEWYAVDRDGHVGLFRSGEEGAVPEAACSENEVSREDIAAAVTLPPLCLLDWLGEDREEQHRDFPDRKKGKGLGPTLMFLASLDPIAREVTDHRVEHEPASEGVAVLFHDLPVETAWRLHEAGACLGCFSWHERSYDFYDYMADRLGLFVYDNGAEDSMAAAYERGEPPSRPLKFEDLPSNFREAMGRVRFVNVRFADAEKIQPIDHFPCGAWGDAYLDLDGRTIRPIPGHEAEFNQADWSRHAPNFRIEVPPDPPEPGSPYSG